MNDLLTVSHVLLWVLVLAEGLVLVAVMRQVGSLLLRVGSSRVLDLGVGPPVGHPAPWVPDDASQVFSDPRGLVVLAFLSTHCSSCEDVVPAINAAASAYAPEVAVVAFGEEDDSELIRWKAKHGLKVPFIRSREAFKNYEVESTPYAFVVDSDRLIAARGGINHVEHLEALIRKCVGRKVSDEEALIRREGLDVQEPVG